MIFSVVFKFICAFKKNTVFFNSYFFLKKHLLMISSIFYALDLFKSPLRLLFNRRQFISTKLGQLFSIGIIIIEIIIATKSDIFTHQNPLSTNSNIRNTNKPLVNLNKKIVAVSIQDDDSNEALNDPSVFSIEISNQIYLIKDGKSQNITSINKNLHFCSQNDFKNVEDFKNFGKGFCLDDNENYFTLEGFWDEPSLSFILIELNVCKNNTDYMNNSNNYCKPQEEIEKMLVGKTFNIYYKDTIIDINDHDNPFKTVIVNDFQYIDPNFKKITNFNFQNLIMISDEGSVFSDFKYYNEVAFVSQNSDLYTRKSTDEVFFSLSIYSDEKTQMIQRSYIKIQDLLAKLGGVMQSLLFLGHIFTHFEYTLLMKNTILNSLYSFKKPKKKKKNNLLKTSRRNSQNPENNTLKTKESPTFKNQSFSQKLESIEIKNRRKSKIKICSLPIKFDRKLEAKLSDSPKCQIFEKHPTNKNSLLTPLNLKFNFHVDSLTNSQMKNLQEPESPINFFRNSAGKNFQIFSEKLKILKLHNFKQTSKNLYFSLLKYLKLGIKRIFPISRLDYDEKLFSHCEKIYEKELDFIEILKKLQEIEKLKKILLNTNQQILFNFLKKPLVHLQILEPERRIKAHESFSIQLINDSGFEMNNFKKAVDEFENSAKKGLLSEVDMRIMRIIDKESSNFLKFADDASPKRRRRK